MSGSRLDDSFLDVRGVQEIRNFRTKTFWKDCLASSNMRFDKSNFCINLCLNLEFQVDKSSISKRPVDDYSTARDVDSAGGMSLLPDMNTIGYTFHMEFTFCIITEHFAVLLYKLYSSDFCSFGT